MKSSELCRDQQDRRRDIRKHTDSSGERDLNGIDYLEVEEKQTRLSVYFNGQAPLDACPPPTPDEPEINYLGKDYNSFRQLILDRLSLITPNWKERHIPDIGITLVELLAYVGDYLSYYQDAVATEAYLETARQRISVRRHAKLVD